MALVGTVGHRRSPKGARMGRNAGTAEAGLSNARIKTEN
jgi:hypothetical protein